MAVSFYFCAVNRDLFLHIHLLGLVVLDKMIGHHEKISDTIMRTKILWTSLISVFLYTVFFFGEGGRYLFTGIREVNQGGLALILLFLMIRVKNRMLGNLLLFMGLLTFSRSYFVGLILFYLTSSLVNRRTMLRSFGLKILRISDVGGVIRYCSCATFCIFFDAI